MEKSGAEPMFLVTKWLQNNIYLPKLFLAMFHFTESFIRRLIRNGFALLITSLLLSYLSFNSFIHYISILLFLVAAGCWIYFGFKFKKQLDSIDEPITHESDSSKLRFFKFIDSLLSVAILISMILTLVFPSLLTVLVLVTVILILFIIRIYQIVVISNYLKQEVRN